MNFSSILSEIERLDPEVYERTSMRRSVIKNWARRVSLTALPFALGSLFKTAYGQTTPPDIVAVLNFALTLEYLESDFYNKALEATRVTTPATPLIPSGISQSAIQNIYDHELAHVRFLTQAIISAGGKVVDKPMFDFSGDKGGGNGPFATAFKDYDLFLAVAQVFEDTGVRAYKGAAPDLMSSNETLTAALRIHSVEARHAAHIRTMRDQTDGPLAFNRSIMPWITGNQSDIDSSNVQASYDGEEVTIQSGTEMVGINGFVQITAARASESFDEPLTMKQVLAIIDPFLPA